jgi:plastocyanin
MAVFSVLTLVFGAQKASAQKTWYATAGAETRDESVQADGFFPNEVWVIAGDSIQWTFGPQNEPHTVTFLAPNQVRPLAPPPVGPPPGTPVVGLPVACGPFASSATYTGSNCVSSNVVADGAKFTVTFPNPGNYKLTCLIHTDMNGTVHVLANTAANAALLHSQQFYDVQGREEAAEILGDSDDAPGPFWGAGPIPDFFSPGNQVLAGVGKIVATGGGTQYGAVVRFLSPVIEIHKGESVTWTNIDPTEPHTVTFGTEPASFVPTVAYNLGTPLADGTLAATVNCPNTATCDADFVQEGTKSATYVSSAFINSGFIGAAAPDRPAPGAGIPPSGDTQVAPGTTRITITFPVAGKYYYHCALHDDDGMYGEVIVLP